MSLLDCANGIASSSNDESVEYDKYDNDQYYDYIALELAREFGNKLAFKGGYMLTKIMTETARRTVDVDLSILSDEVYDDIRSRLTAICEKFPLASFMAAILSIFDSSKQVSGFIFTPVLDGTLYIIIGVLIEFAIAL